MAHWTRAQIGDQAGRLAVVTGATSGIGLVVARDLAAAGAYVVLAVRDAARGSAAAGAIRAAAPSAQLEVSLLDLSSLASVHAFAARLLRERGGPDLLVNNAGIMATVRSYTADGFEAQFGVNHLGHFALTGLLLGGMTGKWDARVVTVSSLNHFFGRVRFDDLHAGARYRRWGAYNQSKLANLLFAFELDRRLRAAGLAVKSTAAHPGYTATDLQRRTGSRLERIVLPIGNRLLAQGVESGALPVLCAATAPGLAGGSYIGPSSLFGLRGEPGEAKASRAARDAGGAARLWEVSERLTGVRFEIRGPRSPAAPPRAGGGR